MNWRDFGQVRALRRRQGRPFVLAHRGAPRYLPENTLASFRLALEQGADCLETDLHFSADGEVVLIHDPTVDRTTDRLGAVRDFSAAQLKAMGTRSPMDNEPTEHGVPTLVDLMDMTAAQVPLILELKDPLFLERDYARRLVETLADHQMLERAAIISFRLEYVMAVREICPTIPIGVVSYKTLLPPPDCELAGPIWPLLFANPLFVWLAHRRGALVAPLDPDPEPRVRLYNRLGVDAVLANDPAAVLAALGGVREPVPDRLD